MYCKECLKEIKDYVYCEVCGDNRLCEECAEDCARMDEEWQQDWEPVTASHQ